MNEELRWKKYPVLNDGFICLVDVMGDDSAIVQAARVSYGKDERWLQEINKSQTEEVSKGIFLNSDEVIAKQNKVEQEIAKKDRSLIRRLMKDQHTSPFEMVEFKFKVRVPMDCWRQWIRHRTANINEYSTRYSEAIDSQQTTLPEEWRLQAKDNKQGSSGFLEEWPKNPKMQYYEGGDSARIDYEDGASKPLYPCTPGDYLTQEELKFQFNAKQLYHERLTLGIAREQARKDLPLSTYTEAYWKCDLHNIFNFLRLRLDPHAQLEIRLYAQGMYDIVKQVCPIACEAFEDYVLNARKFSAEEMKCIKNMLSTNEHNELTATLNGKNFQCLQKPSNMTDNEWKSFLGKLS